MAGSQPDAQLMDRLRRASCGEVIGVYEPMVVLLGDGSEREGSPLSLKAELSDPRSVAIHKECHRPHAA